MEASFIQWVLSVLALAFALLVVIQPNPVMSAMSLLATLFTTGLLYFTLEAYFIGVVQILIYAGAISVLFIFIVMLLDLKPTRVRIPGRTPVIALGVIVGASFLALSLVTAAPILNEMGLLQTLSNTMEGGAEKPLAISLRLLSKYMLPFQVTALLLLAAIMGVVVLGKKTIAKEKGNSIL